MSFRTVQQGAEASARIVKLLDYSTGATFRPSEGSVLSAADVMSFVGNNVRRDENRGDGFGTLLLIEPTRTNVLIHSEEMDNAAWVKTNVTVAVDDTAAPDGVVDADGLSATGGGVSEVTQSTGLAAGDVTLSVWVKERTTSQAVSISLDDGVAPVNLNIVPTATWTRHDLTLLGAAGAVTAKLRLHSTGGSASASDDVFFWGAQAEAANAPSSYIRTVATSATRANEELSFSTAGLPAADLAVLRSGRWRMDIYQDESDVEQKTGRVFMSQNNADLVLSFSVGGLGGDIEYQVREIAGGTDIISGFVTRSRNQKVTVVVNFPGDQMTVAGATTGNGNFFGVLDPWSAAATILFIGTPPTGVRFFGRLGEPRT